MRTVFIVNPKAGKGQGREKFIAEIEAASEKTGVPVEIYRRQRRGARKRASSHAEVTAR